MGWLWYVVEAITIVATLALIWVLCELKNEILSK